MSKNENTNCKVVEKKLSDLVKKLHTLKTVAVDLYTPVESRIFEAAMDGEESVVILTDEPEEEIIDILGYLGFSRKYKEGELVINWSNPLHCEGYNKWHTAEECKDIALQFKDSARLMKKFIAVAEKKARVGHSLYQYPVNGNFDKDLLKIYLDKFYPEVKFHNGILTLEW